MQVMAFENTLAHCRRVSGHTTQNSLNVLPSMHSVMWSNRAPTCLSCGFHPRAAGHTRRKRQLPSLYTPGFVNLRERRRDVSVRMLEPPSSGRGCCQQAKGSSLSVSS